MMMVIIIELQRGQRSCKALFRAIFVLFFNTVHLVMSEKSPVKGQLSFFSGGTLPSSFWNFMTLFSYNTVKIFLFFAFFSCHT